MALLLAYQGPSPELDQLLEHLATLEWGPGAIAAVRAELAARQDDTRS